MADTHAGSLPKAVEMLLDAFTLAAYGVVYSESEPMLEPIIDGVPVNSRKLVSQRHCVSEGVRITNPAFYMEKQSFENQLWSLLRREMNRLNDLGEGLCLKCRKLNDQPRRRFCSKCDARKESVGSVK